MLSNLSFRNAKRQGKEYLVYFITIVLAISLIYAFNGLVFSEEIQNLSEFLESLPWVITLTSIIVVAIIGWLVNYIMTFMLTKRSRELGTYVLLGMENKQVGNIFFLENLLIGIIAFGFGVVLGNLIFQILRAINLWMFGVPYTFSFAISLNVLGLTLLYFILIYAFALLRSRRRIKKMKIYDLIYFHRQNESEVVTKSKNRRRMFRSSIVFGIIGTLLLLSRNLTFGIIGAFFIIIFLYGFFISFSSGVPAFFNKRPIKKYTNNNLLVFRSLASKLNTMGITMATIALLFTATLIAEGTGLLFSNQFERQTTLYTTFDLYIGTLNVNADFNDYIKCINENTNVNKSHEYFIYQSKNNNITEYITGQVKYWKYYEKDTFMKMSDYISLRKILGYKEVSLKPNSYIIHCMDYLESTMKKYNEPIDLNGNVVSKEGVYAEDFTQFIWDGNGRGFIIVVSDELVEDLEPVTKCYAAMTEKPVKGEFYTTLRNMADERAESEEEDETILSPAQVRNENSAMYAMIIFPLFYLALVLTMVAATILTTQLLSDADKYKRQYSLLRNLGMSKEDMKQALSQQFTLFYTMPTIPPILISISFIAGLGSMYDPGILKGAWHLWSIIGTALIIFFAIYLIYILASYTSFKRSVLPE